MYLADEIFDQIFVYANELPSEDSSGVDVGGEGFEGLVVAQNLACTGSRHGCYEETVPDTILSHALLDCVPVKSTSFGLHPPEVEL